MNGYITNIESQSKDNSDFRRVLYTAKNSQLVLMSLLPGEEIGEEVHDVDQFLRIELGTGTAVLNGFAHKIADGSSIVVPAGVRHNIINSQDGPMKLYSLYTPPHHKDGTVHRTKELADSDDEHFDGKISE